jgi:hypothetical protein
MTPVRFGWISPGLLFFRGFAHFIDQREAVFFKKSGRLILRGDVCAGGAGGAEKHPRLSVVSSWSGHAVVVLTDTFTRPGPLAREYIGQPA